MKLTNPLCGGGLFVPSYEIVNFLNVLLGLVYDGHPVSLLARQNSLMNSSSGVTRPASKSSSAGPSKRTRLSVCTMRSNAATSSKTAAGFPFIVIVMGSLLAWILARIASISWRSSSIVLQSSVTLFAMAPFSDLRDQLIPQRQERQRLGNFAKAAIPFRRGRLLVLRDVVIVLTEVALCGVAYFHQ